MSLTNIFKNINLTAAWKAFKSWLRHYIGGIYNRAGDDHVFLQSSGLAFSLFVCIVPLVLIIFAFLGAILEKPSISEEINAFIDRAIPYGQYAAAIKEIIFNRVNEFIVYKNVAGLLGIVGMLFAASGLFSSMRTVLNTVYRVDLPESAISGKLRDLGLVILVLLYFLASVLILPVLKLLIEFPLQFGNWAGVDLHFLEQWVLQMGSFLAIFMIFYIVYFFIPRSRPPNRIIAVSATSATIMWIVAEKIFRLYVMHAVNLKRIYGAYVFLIVVAIWIYYTALVFIMGAEIGQLYRERRQKLSKEKAALSP